MQTHIIKTNSSHNIKTNANNVSTNISVNISIDISISKQTLVLNAEKQQLATYSISTAKNGIGAMEGSGCTPLGKHIIRDKIGDKMPMYTVFVGRVATGEIYDEALGKQAPERDWILSRILWLAGMEEGINKGHNAEGCCDTHQRYIYIHGTPDTEPMGVPLSHGCIRMRNDDIIQLFEQVSEGTVVNIFA